MNEGERKNKGLMDAHAHTLTDTHTPLRLCNISRFTDIGTHIVIHTDTQICPLMHICVCHTCMYTHTDYIKARGHEQVDGGTDVPSSAHNTGTSPTN